MKPYLTAQNYWMITEYDDVVEAITSDLLSSDYNAHIDLDNAPVNWENSFKFQNERAMYEAGIDSRPISSIDGVLHDKMKSTILYLSNRTKVLEQSEFIKELAKKSIVENLDKPNWDVVPNLIDEIAILSLFKALNVPEFYDYQEEIRHASRIILRMHGDFMLDEVTNRFLRLEHKKAVDFLTSMSVPLLTLRKEFPQDNFVSKLAESDLHIFQQVSCVASVLGAGLETTASMLAGTLITLAKNQEAQQELRNRGKIDSRALNELFRLNDVINGWPAVFREDIIINEVMIKKGMLVLPSLYHANRDSKVFENPETINFDRNINPHLSFGRGIHACVGKAIAEVTLTSVLEEILNNTSSFHLDGYNINSNLATNAPTSVRLTLVS